MPASASKFFGTYLQPKEGEVVKGNMREIEVLAHVMDALAQNRVAEVADIVTQRMQACKMAEEDGGWSKAQFAEIIPQNSIAMVRRETRNMAAREEAAQRRMAKVPEPPAGRYVMPVAPIEDQAEIPWIVNKGGKAWKKGWVPVKGGKGKKDQVVPKKAQKQFWPKRHR